MKRFFASLSLLAIAASGTLKADCCCPNSFYIKAGTGISFSQPANVFAPPSTWNPAVQGYDSRLGNRAIGSLSLGWEYGNLLDFEVSISHRSNFQYRKFQTAVNAGGSYTREFDLDVTPVLFSVYLLGRDIPCLNWDLCCGKIYPFIGAGIGVSYLSITNFRTTGLPPSGDSDPFASFASENQLTKRRNLTYTALIGFEYNYNNTWAISTGYRWLDAGKFDGPRYIRVANGAAVDVGNDAWRMRFRANEWFVEFKIFI